MVSSRNINCTALFVAISFTFLNIKSKIIVKNFMSDLLRLTSSENLKNPEKPRNVGFRGGTRNFQRGGGYKSEKHVCFKRAISPPPEFHSVFSSL